MNEDLIQSTVDSLNRVLDEYKNPVIAFSGGKDSTVMLHILRACTNWKLPTIFWHEPFQTHKNIHALKLIAEWGLVVHNYPPIMVTMWQGKGVVAYTNHFQIGTRPDGMPTTLDLPKNVIAEGWTENPMCGKEAFLNRPTARFSFPWDLILIGHKSSDEDQIAGKVPLQCDVQQNVHGPDAYFPLRNWTDKDVWDYIAENNVPIDHNRYDQDGRKELRDKSANPDYYSACIRCIDRREGPFVSCPKLNGLQVANVSSDVIYADSSKSYHQDVRPV